MSRFIILCGGTGGHLAPGIAVGQALIKEGHSASFVISNKQVDSRLMSKYSDLHVIKSPGIAFPKNPLRILKFFAELFKAVRLGLKTMSAEKYDVLISFGGFNSLGFSIAAWLSKVPIVVHEANRKAGKATRLLGLVAERIYVPYGVKIRNRDISKIKCSGYPIRDEIRRHPPELAREKFGFDRDAKLLLVLGGSQGAAALNNWATENFGELAKNKIDVLCVCGQGKSKGEDLEAEDADGAKHRLKYMEFCDDMGTAMSAADVVVARAGAGSIAEFARCAVPSIIVPYPYAADNHQLENAKCFEKQGACVVVLQENLGKMLKEVLELFRNEKLKAAIRKNLNRVDDLNDMSKMVRDLAEIAARRRRE